MPTADEMQALWWRSNVQYFDNESSSSYKPVKRDKIKSRIFRKVVRKEVRTKVSVHTEVHEGDSDESDVDVDEESRRLTKTQILKKMVNMKNELGSRLASIEQLVKPAMVHTEVHTKDPVGVVQEPINDPVVKDPVEESVQESKEENNNVVKDPADVVFEAMQSDVDATMKCVEEFKNPADAVKNVVKDGVKDHADLLHDSKEPNNNAVKDLLMLLRLWNLMPP